jgi:hypothetical protein
MVPNVRSGRRGSPLVCPSSASYSIHGTAAPRLPGGFEAAGMTMVAVGAPAVRVERTSLVAVADAVGDRAAVARSVSVPAHPVSKIRQVSKKPQCRWENVRGIN